jgi:hypothetical protein
MYLGYFQNYSFGSGIFPHLPFLSCGDCIFLFLLLFFFFLLLSLDAYAYA